MTKTVLTVERMVGILKVLGPSAVMPGNAQGFRELAENEHVVKLIDAALAVTKAQIVLEAYLIASQPLDKSYE